MTNPTYIAGLRGLLPALLLGAFSNQASADLNLPDPVISQTVNVGTQVYSFKEGSLQNAVNDTSGSTSVVLGVAPQISGALAETSGTQGRHGGSVSAQLLYNVAYVNPNIGSAYVDIPVHVDVKDLIKVSGSGPSFSAYASTFFEVSRPGGAPVNFTHCAMVDDSGGSCSAGLKAPIVPFDFAMRQNTVYQVMMTLTANVVANVAPGGVSSASVDAMVDPTFSVIGNEPAGGHFVFSAGVTAPVSGVPEPSSLWLALVGAAACLGLTTRRRSNSLWLRSEV
jgi:hypothetical protein